MRTYRLAGSVVGAEEAVFLDMLGVDYISAKQVHNYLQEADGEDITFNLNSGGGSVFAGNEIYTMLSTYTGRVIINITGVSASIASVFMLGADEVNIAHQGQIMIHKPSIAISERVEDVELEKYMNLLKSTEKSLVKVYTKRTGMSEEKILEMMLNETWLNSDEALELGFVDNVFNAEETSEPLIEDLVAMVHSTEVHMGILKEIKNMRGVSMDKTFLEKLKAIISGTPEEEVAVEPETPVEEPVKEVQEEVQEEVKEESVVEEPVKEVEDTTGLEHTENNPNDVQNLLEKAVAEIESLRAEVAELRTENEELKNTNESLKVTNSALEIKESKSKDVVAKLNALLENEEAKVVAVTQKTSQDKNTMPVGYKGIRGGLN